MHLHKFVGMVRAIVKPTKNNLTIRLPDHLIGKMVEVIAFELEAPADAVQKDVDKAKRIKAIAKGLDKYRTDLTSFKFSRDEANDYD